MYSTEPNPNGVWTHIVAHTPRPEVEELAKIIGKKSIDKNEVCFIFLLLLLVSSSPLTLVFMALISEFMARVVCFERNCCGFFNI